MQKVLNQNLSSKIWFLSFTKEVPFMAKDTNFVLDMSDNYYKLEYKQGSL